MYDKRLAVKSASKVTGFGISETPGQLHPLLTSGGASGEPVTQDTAMGVSAFYACLRNIAEDIGKLTLRLYRPLDRGRELITSGDIHDMLRWSPNDNMTALVFWSMLMQWKLAWGNGYAEIERTNRGEPIALWPIHPSRVVPMYVDGLVVYKVLPDSMEPDYIPAADMLNIVGLTDDGVKGYSVLQIGVESIGRAIAVQKFGAAFFGNNTTLGTLFEYPRVLSEKARNNIRQSWKEYSTASNAHKSFILEEGLLVKNAGVPPEQAQMLETMEFTIDDVARWFRCPPHKIQHFLRAQGWSTLEVANTEYVTDTLQPHATSIEQELRRKLLNGTGLYAKFDFRTLMRGDSPSRATYYKNMLDCGAMSPNDIREAEDLNPVDDGDTYYISTNLKPMDQPLVDTSTSMNSEQVKLAMMPVTVAATERLCRKERQVLDRAAKKHADDGLMSNTVSEFVGEHQAEIVEVMQPIADTMVMLLNADTESASVYVKVFAGEHSAGLTSHAADGTYKEWLADLPASLAETFTTAIGALA